MEDSKKYQLFCELIRTLDEGFDHMIEYDSLLHDYNGVVLFQAESQIIKIVGDQPGITASELAKILKKTSSACSQLIRKLKQKQWIRQKRNKSNNREYNLHLTEEGKLIYQNHQKFEQACYVRTFHMLDGFSTDEMETYIKVQQKLNRAFDMDVEESKNLCV